MTQATLFRDRLAESVPFEGCAADEVESIARRAERAEASPGEVLTREGEAGDRFFVILQGTATVTRAAMRIATIGPGAFFGETAVLTGGPRTATVTADTKLVLASLDKRRFDEMLTEVPGVARRILQGVAERSTPMTFFL